MNLGKFTVANVLCRTMMSATALTYIDGNNNGGSSQTDQNTSNLVKYVTNWAALLGYDIAQDQKPTLAQTASINYEFAENLELLIYNTFFGSIPTTTPPITSANSNSNSNNQGAGLPFMPQDTNSTTINKSSNLTFKGYNNAGGSSSGSQQNAQQAAITANALVDQQPYQSDPVTQAIYNIVGTPDVSYCGTAPSTNPFQGLANSTNPNGPSGTACSTIGTSMFQSQLIENSVGKLSALKDFYSITSNANVLPQLNSNSLIAPLSYTTDTLNFSSGGGAGEPPGGLTASNQAQLAANFIRYASGSVLPTILPNQYAYQTVYNSATDNTDPNQFQSQAIISTYLNSLRVYAAQSSVGIGNLYYILSKRIPQQQTSSTGGDSSQLNSQAFNEYNMATWRIFQVGGVPAAQGSTGSGSSSSGSGSTGSGSTGSSSGSGKAQWIEKLNTSSPATVQKEIAILLAEINYQLYLDRQLQERMLMTSSVSLLQGTKATQPSSDLSNQITAASPAIPQ